MSTSIELPPPPPPVPETAAVDAEFTAPLIDTPERTCPNCGAPAHGPYCYACGQSEKGMIRHLSEVLSDLADIVFNVDSRIFRSLWDLYVRPGYLTTEYVAGRRARYVTPFRLFFFLSIIAFFSMQMALPEINPNELKFGVYDNIEEAATPEDVTKAVDASIAALTAAKDVPAMSPKARAKLEEKIEQIRNSGVNRLAELEEAAKSPTGAKTPPKKHSGRISLFGDEPWDSKTNLVSIGWLSEGLNAKLNRTLEHMQENLDDINKNPGRLLAGFFSVLPQTLFVLMPLFAVLLKFFYLFKRRLYMEHLLVALHSHAFIFMSVLVILGLGALEGLAAGRLWLSQPIGWLRTLAWTWLFLYLFLMQKRVYRQGWIMTTLKYSVIGISYSVVLSIALVFAGLISLALT
ncbi:DUF3667 domain-containing protein [Dokdonella sp.]|uniref:DUF3667 domain-containing protein n=1 Tax=Dokdonella sp. TaxID=2291710 RepID=UPI002C95F385|nr:DUF3667 domain-containing protein [Dokdonella sp.]HOX70629.1 DUF3667 domain-containing protein [Dokdonella sp.]HOX71897.1 DUF3667 domain-containing protein [Dokdonella sp.]HPN78892.1 DUF3667 domain-containing protein [Dokdonella sp.]